MGRNVAWQLAQPLHRQEYRHSIHALCCIQSQRDMTSLASQIAVRRFEPASSRTCDTCRLVGHLGPSALWISSKDANCVWLMHAAKLARACECTQVLVVDDEPVNRLVLLTLLQLPEFALDEVVRCTCLCPAMLPFDTQRPIGPI
jgi:CheY-like chemotaxis protein